MQRLTVGLATFASLAAVNAASAQEAASPLAVNVGEEDAALRAECQFSPAESGVVTNASLTYIAKLDELTLFIGASLLAESIALGSPQASFAAGLRFDGSQLLARASSDAVSFDLVLVAP